MLSAYDEVQHMLASQLPNAILLRLYLNQVHSHSIRSLSQQLHPVSELMHQDQSYKLCIYGAIHNIIYIYIYHIYSACVVFSPSPTRKRKKQL